VDCAQMAMPDNSAIVMTVAVMRRGREVSMICSSGRGRRPAR
jgi:hypothetical protein